MYGKTEMAIGRPGDAMGGTLSAAPPKETSILALSQNVLDATQYNLAQLLSMLDQLEGTNVKADSSPEARPAMPIQGNLQVAMSQLEHTHQVIAKLRQKLFN